MKKNFIKYVIIAGCAGFLLLTGYVDAASQYYGCVFYIKDNNFWINDLSNNASNQITHLEVSIGTGVVSNPSISVDGTKIIFSYKANTSSETSLYSIGYDGSGLENISSTYNLTAQTKNQTYGALSPDMTKIAFAAEPRAASPTNGRQLWLQELTGLKRLFQLTFMNGDCQDIQFLDDSHIIFKHKLQYLEDFYIISTNGSDLTNLTNNNSIEPYFPRLGRPYLNQAHASISYAKQTQDANGYSNWDIYQLDIQTMTEVQILTNLYFPVNPEIQADPQPVLITDSSSIDTAIVFRGTREFSDEIFLYIASFESQNPYITVIPESTNAKFPMFFPSTVKPVKFVYTSGSPAQVYVVNSSNQIVQLTQTINTNYDPVIDPSGSIVAYAGNGIWKIKADGTDAVQIDTLYTARYPAISPDGKWIAYVKSNDIYARKVDLSSPIIRLTNSPNIEKLELSFAPSKSEILYTGSTESGHQIFSLPITISSNTITVNGQPTNLTQNPGYENYQASYSPDGKKIIFISTRQGSPAIFIMNPDGSAQQQIVLQTQPSNPCYPQFSSWQDDVRIAFISAGYINIANLETKSITQASPAISPAGKFSWGKLIKNNVSITRQLPYNRVDGNLPYYIYCLNISINPLNTPTSFIITEQLPTISSGASANWKITGAWFNDIELSPLTSSGNTTGIVKWIVSNNIGSIFPITDGTLKLKIEFDGGTPVSGSWNFINGSIIYGSTKSMISGDSYIAYGEPDCPADTDGDKKISDSELLFTIDAWAVNSRIDGWPIILSDWDLHLLKIINFWAKGGYIYAPSAIEPSWRSKSI